VNEDVYAYSNRYNDKGSLFIFNNKFATAKGWIKRSAAYKDKASGQLRQRDVHEGLNTHGNEKNFVILRDHIAGLEYMRPSRDVQRRGLYFELEAFKYRVFTDIREVYDADGNFQALYDQIGWQGVPNVQDAKEDLRLTPLHQKFRELILLPEKSGISVIESALQGFLDQGKNFGLSLTTKAEKTLLLNATSFIQTVEKIPASLLGHLPKTELRQVLNAYGVLSQLKENWTQPWRLFRIVPHGDLLGLMLSHAQLLSAKTVTAKNLLSKITEDKLVLTYLRVNEHQGVKWFNQESYEALVYGLTSAAWCNGTLSSKPASGLETLLTDLLAAQKKSDYQLAKLVPARKTTKKVSELLQQEGLKVREAAKKKLTKTDKGTEKKAKPQKAEKAQEEKPKVARKSRPRKSEI
jgi:hypothetical protein